MNNKDRFIANGQQKHLEGIKEKIAEKVRSKYAEQLQQAGFFGRMRTRLQISREIREELSKCSPSNETLYLRK